MRFDFVKKFNIRNKYTKVAIIALIVLLVCLVTGIGAKYIFENRGKLTQASALDFYFTVDLLGDTNELSELETDIHLFGGGNKSLSFNVQNYFDSLRVNAKDIRYTATLECDDPDYTKAAFSASPGDYVIATASGAQQDLFTVNCPTGYEKDGKAVTVTATIKSSSPYVKEMKINLVLHSEDAPLTYRVEDSAGDNVATLIVMANENIPAGKLAVDWSAVNGTENLLQVDTTSPHVLDGTLDLTTNDTGTGFLKEVTTTRTIAKGESIQIYFFKANPALDYSMPNTQVTADANGVYNVSIEK